MRAHITTSCRGELDGGSVQDLRIALESKIKRMIDRAQLRTRPAYEVSQGQITTAFEFFDGSHRFTDMNYRFDFEGSSQVDAVRYGEGRLNFANYIPTRTREVFSVSFWIDLGEDLHSDGYLAAMEPVNRIQVRRELPILFHQVMRAKIIGSVTGRVADLQLQTRNLVARNVKWDFGDGKMLIMQSPKHTYATDGVFEVVATVNNDSLIVARAWVDTKSGMIHETKPVSGLVEPEVLPLMPVVVPVAPTVVPVNPAMVELAKNRFEEYLPIRNSMRLVQKLQADASENRVKFGSEREFDSLENLVVAIADPQNVYEYLVFTNQRYVSLFDGREYENLSSFVGEGRRQIWIQHFRR